jgi:hypothetical protein
MVDVIVASGTDHNSPAAQPVVGTLVEKDLPEAHRICRHAFGR